ncbi:MAG TPA: ABC transporter substrate-binding protein, partial [Bacillota bacterium]|nr:ABC transporter substrate-binding protein [Bacillota bacterium]
CQPTSASQFIGNDKYNTAINMPMYTAVIAMNNTVPPFDNKLVRQAFAYAADRESIINVYASGYATPASFMCSDTNCWGVDYGDSTDYAYNPEKAKELLAEAGYPNGINMADFGVELKTFSGHSKIATVYQQNLADIGVTIAISNTSTPDEDVESGNFAIMNQGITYRADFSYSECHYGSVGIGGNNYAQVIDPYVDEMFAKALAVAGDDNARAAIYAELVPYLIDYCPNVYLFHRQNIYAWTKGLNANVKDSSQFTFHCYEWSWE